MKQKKKTSPTKAAVTAGDDGSSVNLLSSSLLLSSLELSDTTIYEP